MKVNPNLEKEKKSEKKTPGKKLKETSTPREIEKESPLLGPIEDDIKIEISQDERSEVIDKFLMGEPIEKDYVLFKKNDKGISIKVRAVSAELMEYADRLLYKNEDISMAEAITANNNNLIGVQIAKFMDKDFVKEQGENYDTEEGVTERINYMKKRLILPVRSLIIEKMRHFQAWCSEIFSPESLENF